MWEQQRVEKSEYEKQSITVSKSRHRNKQKIIKAMTGDRMGSKEKRRISRSHKEHNK